MKKMIKSLALRIPKVRQIKDSIDIMRGKIKDLEILNAELMKKKEVSLRLLEGTPYSTIALPLDYPPSRDYKPRWGGSKPVEPIIHSWFKKHI